jgi:hypothetical protein
MVLQTVRNLPEFHSVIADSLVSIINHLAADEPSAKKIMMFNIRQAYVLYRMDTQKQRVEVDQKLAVMRQDMENAKSKTKQLPLDYDNVLKEELDAMGLDRLNVDELQIKMFTYLTLAGIKPVQSTAQRAAGYAKFAGE